MLKSTADQLATKSRHELSFTPGLACGRCIISCVSKKAQSFIIDHLLQARAVRIIRRPRNAFVEVFCGFDCSTRDARKLSRIAKMQSMYALSIFQSVVVDEHPIRVHHLVAQVQALVRGRQVFRLFKQRKDIENSEGTHRNDTETEECSRRRKIFSDFNNGCRLALEHEFRSAEVLLRYDECTGWNAIVIQSARSLETASDRNRDCVLDEEERIRLILTEFITRTQIAVNASGAMRKLLALHKINIAQVSEAYYLYVAEFQDILSIRNTFRRVVHFAWTVPAPLPPSNLHAPVDVSSM